MLALLSLILLAAAGYGIWRLGGRFTRQDDTRGRLWRLAAAIGVVRISALWLGAIGLNSPGSAQIWGYGLLMMDLPELYLAKSARHQPFAWVIIATAILAATSFLWASIVIRIGARLRLAATSG